jgi:hypothetical protein
MNTELKRYLTRLEAFPFQTDKKLGEVAPYHSALRIEHRLDDFLLSDAQIYAPGTVMESNASTAPYLKEASYCHDIVTILFLIIHS